MNDRENLLRAARFEKPERIPMTFHINPACWAHYSRASLLELMAAHPMLFPDHDDSKVPIEPEIHPVARADRPFIDDWGCCWETREDGITGLVTGHPLADWEVFDGFEPPDPETTMGIGPANWPGVKQAFETTDQEGRICMGGLRHGHTFSQLCDLRGYEQVVFDMADNEPRLVALIGMIESFNLELVERFIELGAEWIGYPEDLGMQSGPLLSPEQFRRFIKPSYQRIMRPAREAGCVVHLHSDGDLHALAVDLLDCGIDVLNLQDRINGIDWIAGTLSGKVCVDLDIDRQHVTASGTPEEIDGLIREAVEKLGSRDGGLMMIYGLYPGVPLRNAAAVMDAMERYAAFHS